jgi:nucleoside phosphorylase
MMDEECLSDVCRSIIHFVGKYGPEADAIRQMLLRDLCWKTGRLSALDRAKILAEMGCELLPPEVQGAFPPESFRPHEWRQLKAGARERKDVGIVTVIGTEMRSFLRVFHDSESIDAPHSRRGDFNYWEFQMDRADRGPMSIVATMVGRPRNVPCVIAVDHLLHAFDVGLMILVGVAAGPKDKVQLGDIVYAETVHDYEHKRLEWRKIFGGMGKSVELPRPLTVDVVDSVRSALQRFDVTSIGQSFMNLVKEMDRKDIPTSVVRVPDIHNGTILAGEKLIADGSLPRKRKTIDERIRAADQEDSGFAQACKAYGVPWCIFRGICDYADPNKGGKWQPIAALAAAVAAITFLRTAW